MAKKYLPEEDKILWSSEKRQFKPEAMLCAQIKSYKGGQPKVMLVEDGVGFSGRDYSGFILKRVYLEDLDLVLDLLNQAKPVLEHWNELYKMKKEGKK